MRSDAGARVFPGLCVLLVLFATSVAFAQLGTSTLNGIVSDPSGAAVPGAKIILKHPATGTERVTTTASDGSYAFANTAPSTYDLRIEASGFAPKEFKGVLVEVGRATTVDAKMEVAPVGEVVRVEGGGTPVEITQSQIQGVVGARTVEELPLNGRNFLELAFLIPGNRPATNFDPTKTNTLEVSSAGQFGRGGNLSVDGADNNDDVVGGTLQNFSQDTIQEFQIITNRFSAEIGRSASSAINIITKSGTNELHGAVYGFFRSDALQGRPATDDRRVPKAPFDRQQIGFTLGGPIKHDRLWWFYSLENWNQDSAIQVGERDLAARRIVARSAPAALDNFLSNARVDWQASPNNRFSFRYSFTKDTDLAQASLRKPIGTAAQRQSSSNRYQSFVLNWTRTISPRVVNELMFHSNAFLNEIPQFIDGHELRFPDLQDGGSFRVPQRTRLRKNQLRENLSWKLGEHSLKFGAEWINMQSDALFDLFGSGTVFLTENFATQDRNGDGRIDDNDIPVALSIASTAPIRPPFVPDIDNTYLGFYVQDDWRIRPNFTFNFGLRYDLDTDLTGVGSAHRREFFVTQLGRSRSRDANNFAPRIGFAWDPFKDGKTSIRGGYGIYYDRIVLEVRLLELLLDGRTLSLAVTNGSTLDANGRFIADPTTRQVVTLQNPLAGAPLIGAGAIGINLLDNDIAHPYVQQWSLGFQRELVKDLVLSVDGVHAFGQRFIIGRIAGSTFNPFIGATDTIVNLEPSAKNWYSGLLVNVNKRFAKHWGFTSSYTLSKAFNYFDDDQIPFNEGGQIDSNNLRREKGFTPTDERHRFTFAGVFDLPWGFRFSPIWTMASDVPVNPFSGDLGTRIPLLSRNAGGRTVRTGSELNAVIQQCNTISSCSRGNRLPLVPSDVEIGDSFHSFDFRFSKTFTFKEKFKLQGIVEVFNLFNVTNIRGFNNNNFSGFQNAIGSGFGTPLQTAGGFFGAGGPRAFQFAAHFSF